MFSLQALHARIAASAALLGGLAVSLAWGSPAARAADCTGNWELFSSAPYVQIALPDTYVTYYRYRFQLPDGDDVALKITGDFPYARYMNFNVYDAVTGDSVSTLPDRLVVPDQGSSNPYLPGVSRSVASRRYTAWVVPSTSPAVGAQNTLALPAPAAGTARYVELWYRVYVPDQGLDPLGGKPLPTVEAVVDQPRGAGAPCPAVSDQPAPSVIESLGNLPPHDATGRLAFYRPTGAGLYANLDNLYLATRFALFPRDVAVVTFQAPTFPDTGAGLPSFTGQEDVRYWSLCLGGADQKTSSCLDDAAMHKDGAGMVHLVIGPESVRQTALARGFDFLPWGRQLLQFLIYRNLLARTDFPGNMRNVPGWTVGGDAQADAADGYLGAYAPRGIECSVDSFQQDSCGMAASP